MTHHTYLSKVYDPAFVSSLDRNKYDEMLLHRILTGTTPDEAIIWREHLEACLRLANGHRLLDDDSFISRLRQKNLQGIEATFGELESALFFEMAGRRVAFYPQGRNEKVIEFRVNYSEMDGAMVEVKSLFPEEIDQRHSRAVMALRQAIWRCRFPFIVFVNRISTAPVRTNGMSTEIGFGRKPFQLWLEGELAQLPRAIDKSEEGLVESMSQI